jgi:molecular chaperone GrpE
MKPPISESDHLPQDPPESQSPEILDPIDESGDVAPDDNQKVRELQEQMIRMQADFDNFRKRLTREREEAVKFANQTLLEDLLPVIDNFELGLKASENAQDAKGILMGLQMVKSQLDRFLAEHDVTEVPASGLFDPHQHEAVGTETSDTLPDGTIVSVQRKGYRLKQRLLRPATVIVAHPAGKVSEDRS